MIISKSIKYFRQRAEINKRQNQSTARKIQIYNNSLVDKYVESLNNGVPIKPPTAVISAELSIINQPQVYKNYQRIINSPYTSNDNLNKMFIKNQANKELDRIVTAEVERITKNLNYVEKVFSAYNIPQKEYTDRLNAQKSRSLANRQQILKDVAIKSNDLLVSEGLNIPSNVFSYRDLEMTAESLLRQSNMQSEYEKILEINDNYESEGKEAPYNNKVWIWTGAGNTTRHESNNMQHRRLEEYFVVTNDVTGEIDEMMYPSDPMGSPSNAYICYCEVEYGNEDSRVDVDTVGFDWTPTPLSTATNTPSVTFNNSLAGLGGIRVVEPKAPSVEPIKATENTTANDYLKNEVKTENNANRIEYKEIKINEPKTETTWQDIIQEKPVKTEPTIKERTAEKQIEPTRTEPTAEQLKSSLTKEELETVRWAKDVQNSKFITETGKAKARQQLQELYDKALNSEAKSTAETIAEQKITETPVEVKTATQNPSTMTSNELYESMTKADKKRYDKAKSNVENVEKQIKILGESDLLLKIKEKNLLEVKKLEQKQRDKLANKRKPKDKAKPSPYQRNLNNIHKEIEIPTENLIPKLEKWINKRCKNVIEFGYNFNIKTGELIGEEIKGKKGNVKITDLGKNTGTIHSHPRNGMAFPSLVDLESFRCQRGEHHFMMSEHEVWYVKATDSFGKMGMGQQLDLQRAYRECESRAFNTVEKLIKEGKVDASEESIADALNKHTGDELLKTFNSADWNKRLTVKRYYR